MGKFLVLLTVFSAIFAGGAIYYLQVYGFYDTVEPTGPKDVQLVLALDGVTEPVLQATASGRFSKHSLTISMKRRAGAARKRPLRVTTP